MEKYKEVILALIDFAWKNRAFDNPQSAAQVEQLRQETLKLNG
jgi:hypothetical protein